MIKKHCEISRLPERVSIADADWALVSSSGQLWCRTAPHLIKAIEWSVMQAMQISA